MRFPVFRRQGVLALLLLSFSTTGCSRTMFRILRHREPNALTKGVFPVRQVQPAATPFEFYRAPVLRDDMDSLQVRDTDGRRITWGDYMAKRSILAFVVIRNDTIVYERYRQGFTADRIHNSFSVAKSVLSALLGAAIADGSIRSLDQLVVEFVPGLRNKPAFAGMTLKHLLDMKSGLRFSTADGNFWHAARSDEANIYYTTNLLEQISGTPRELPPGTTWKYKDTDTELLGIVISRATGKTIAAYTEEKLWKPIGASSVATWQLDRKNGAEKVSTGLNATALDYARFGRLYLNGGNWNGVQVVPADWVARSIRTDSSRVEPEVSTWWQMQHSYYWWHPLQPVHGDFYADGSNGQRIYVDPANRIIMVQLANDSEQDFPFRRIAAFMTGKQWNYPRLIPGTMVQTGRTFGVDSIRPVFTRLMQERSVNPSQYVITASGMRAAGRVLLDSVRTRAAGVAVLELATEYSPTIAAGFVALSDAYTLVGDNTRALTAIERAKQLAPENPEVLTRLSKLVKK